MNKPEVWQRGPVPGIPALLQPAAHALLQAREEADALMANFPEELLWLQPGGSASVGFHLQHLSGVLDRVFTYAQGQPLTQQQRDYLAAEGKPNDTITSAILLSGFSSQIDRAMEQLSSTNKDSLNDFRGVGKLQLPSTVGGLLFHGAEHTMRHLGQLIVTVKWVKSGIESVKKDL